MIERCDGMARQKLKAKEKKTQKITKYGLIEKSQETGKQTNISNKISDFSLDKKQSKGQNTEKTKEAGYMENWQYNKTYSGCPQGGICSPIFANIYLHELDKFVRETAEKFEKPSERYRTKEYKKIEYQINKIRKKLKNIEEEKREDKQILIQQIKSMRKELLKTPCKSQTDKKIK